MEILIILFFFACSNLAIFSYTIESEDVNNIESQFTITIEYLSKEKIKVSVQSFPVSDTNIESYNLVFDMKFREDYEGDFTGVCIGPSWEKFGPGEFSLVLDIQTIDGDIYLVGVATDYAGEYPDAPYIWKQNKLNQIEVVGTSNIEKYSINFELSN